jgi:hypothetical protein
MLNFTRSFESLSVRFSVSPMPQQQIQPSTLRVVRGADVRYLNIGQGKTGSYQTAREMARLVREAAVKDIALEKFTVEILTRNGLDSHADPDSTIDALFRYVQKIPYISDTTGTGNFDAIQTARDTIELGKGDCDDLSILLATLLSLVGFRPAFVMARMNESSKGFDHIYVEVWANNERIALDPTSKKFGMGWESPKILEKVTVPIFPSRGNGLGDASLIQTGIQAGISLIGGLFGSGNSAQRQQQQLGVALGQSFDQTDKALAAFLLTLNIKANNGTLTADDYLAAQNGVEALQAAAQREISQDATGYVRRQWTAEAPRYQQWLQALGAKVVSPSAAVLPVAANSGLVPGSTGPVLTMPAPLVNGIDNTSLLVLGGAALALVLIMSR